MPPEVDLEDFVVRARFAPQGPLRVAVSGGPDSLAALALAATTGRRVVAVHVAHGLRSSEREIDLVRDAAVRLGADLEVRRVQVGLGPNLEARARAARLAALPVGTATGHTADDQAETVLLNLLRGAGADGLSGMRPGPTHPILDLRRSETEEICRRVGLAPFRDPMNDDLRFRRNQVRHRLLPLLAEIAGRDLVPILARQAGVLADEVAHLEALASALDPTDPASLLAAPRPLARRAVRAWLRGGSPHPPNLAAVERVLEVAAGWRRATEVAPHTRIERRAGRLVLVLANTPPPAVAPSGGADRGRGPRS